MVICAVYRSPNSTKTNDDELCKWIEGMRGTYMILGDFNLPDIRWKTGCAGAKGRRFLETTKNKFLIQHVETETHNSGNTLDLILSNKENMVSDVVMIGKLGKSDHHALMCSVEIGIKRLSDTRKFRDYRRANVDEMRRYMRKNWEEETRGMDVNGIWLLLKHSLESAENKFVPLRKRKPTDEPKWMDSEVRAKIWEKRVAWNEWKRSR